MTSTVPAPSDPIFEAIERLRQTTQLNVQADWQYCTADVPPSQATSSDLLNWLPVQLNAKGHIAWPAGRQVLWLSQRFVIPRDLQGYPLAGLALRLALTWWAVQAEIFVNGELVQEGDLFDSSARVLLSPSAKTGDAIAVALRLVSPGHDDGALMRSLLVYESTDNNRIDPGFVASELAVLHKYLSSDKDAIANIENLKSTLELIEWEALTDARKFERSLDILRQQLQSQIPQAKSTIYLVGHTHLDLAWLWPVSETWDVAQRTFESVLKLQQEFPNLTFCHTTPALYAWIEQHRPDLFAAIQQLVAAGRWEIVAGMWVEPELNLINGESIVRQILYGQRYIQEKFGQLCTVVWLPDTFGFCATLPQFLKQGGIEYFVTQKLRWNDTTAFPYGVFWWRSPDGTEIFSLMSAPIGEGIDPVKMATYAVDWEKQTSLKESLWLPGVGDHGGGPTRDMLEVAQRWEQSPFFPTLKFTTAQEYLSLVSNKLSVTKEEELRTIPTWEDELYLEFHRGCYTTHADQKLYNRRCEGLLYEAELFASLATISAGVIYPHAELEEAWKKVLFNQFHDILPGSSIPQVYVDANQAWQDVDKIGNEILDKSLEAIASQISLPTPPHPDALPIIVFNSLNWKRSEVVAVSIPPLLKEVSDKKFEIYDLEGEPLPFQLQEDNILFLASNIPSVGYRIFWLCKDKSNKIPHSELLIDTSEFLLENEVLRVIVDSETGDLSSVFDKTNDREILSSRGNQLQAFQDKGQYWDAWNIDPNYSQHPLPPAQLKSINWLERGEVRSRLRVVRQIGQSEFCQDYILEVGSAILKIATTVNWQERGVLVKAAFPLNLTADFATYEIPCGAIERTTHPTTPAEQAKWEVSALRWADLSNGISSENSQKSTNNSLIQNPKSKTQNAYGVSLLNDCKYGYDAQPNQLRLTLLRSASWPDPEADRGYHEFTYALYPHDGNWQSAHTVRRGYELNLPLQAMLYSSSDTIVSACHSERNEDERRISHLPPVASLLDLQAENLIVMAFKRSEDNQQEWILRCYECCGEEAELLLQSDLGLAIAHSINLLEQPVDTPKPSPDEQTFKIAPWKIVSFTAIAQSGKSTE